MESKTTISTGNKFKGNPRKISEKQKRLLAEHLSELGDLSGVVYCHNNKAYVGGNQRADVFNGAEIEITERFESPTNHHTIAHGFIVWQGEKYVYREVAFTPEQFRKACIVANNDGGEFDFDVLKMDWDIGELSEWGLDLPDDLGIDIGGDDEGGGESADAEPQINKAKDLNEKWQVRSGDLWLIGNHRLLCGDSTIREDVERLMGGEKADIWITDPPYGVSYADKNSFLNAFDKGNRCQTEIENDHHTIEEMAVFWQKAAENAYLICSDKSAYYVFSAQGGELMMMMMSVKRAKWQLKHGLVWVKNNHVLGRCDYSYKHEPILYGWKQDGTHKFYGGFQTSIFEIDKPLKSEFHPTTKPIELIEKLLTNSTLKNEVVYDGFLGSGTTMIAAERLKRRCFGCELSSDYVAVCLERMKTAFPALEIRKEV